MQLLKRSIWIITGLIIAVPFFVYAFVNWYELKFEKLPVYGETTIDMNGNKIVHQIEKFEFKNQDGRIISTNELKNKIIVANFFFTSCAGICPNMMKHVKTVQKIFLNDNRIAFVSFTVDPSRDSEQRLKWYASQYNINNTDWNLLTGDKKQIYKLARKSFYLSANGGDGGDNDFIHSEQLVLIDADKHIRGYYNGTDDKAVEQLKHDIKKLEYEN